MAVRSIEDCSIPTVPRAAAVVLRRLNVEGLSLPSACRISPTRHPPLEYCDTPSLQTAELAPQWSRRVAVRSKLPALSGRRRVRSPPSRLIAEVAAVSRKTAPGTAAHRVSSREREKFAVNGYKMKQSIVPTGARFRAKEPEEGQNSTTGLGKVIAGANIIRQEPRDLSACPKSLSVCVTRSGLSAVSKTATNTSDRHTLRRDKSKTLQAKLMLKRRRVRARFTDSSDNVSDVEEGVVKEGRSRKRGRCAASRTIGTRSVPKKRRKLSSSEDEICAVVKKGQPDSDVISNQLESESPLPPSSDLEPDTSLEAPPTSSSELQTRVEEEGWTTSPSDDDLTVSTRLEELQRRQRRRDGVLLDRISEEKDESTPDVSSKIVCVSSPSVVYEGEILRDTVGATCVQCDNLEIDPSAIDIACYECVISTTVSSAEEETGVEPLQPSVFTRKLLFGANRRRHRSPQVKFPAEKQRRDSIRPKLAEVRRTRTGPMSTEGMKTRGRPKSADSDKRLKETDGGRTRGRPKSADGDKTRGRLKGTDGGRTRGRPKSTDSDKTKGRLKGMDGGRTRGRPKSTDSDKTRGRLKGTDGGRTRGRPKLTDSDKTRGRLKGMDGGKTRGRPKSTDSDKTRGRLKGMDGGKTRGRPKSTDSDKTRGRLKGTNSQKRPKLVEGEKPRRQPKSSEGGETMRRPKSSEDGGARRRPKSSEGGEARRRPKPSEGGEARRRPKSSEGGEARRRPKSSEGGEAKRRPKSSEGGETRRTPKSSEGGETRRTSEGGETTRRPKSTDTGKPRQRSKSEESGKPRGKPKLTGSAATPHQRTSKPVKEKVAKRLRKKEDDKIKRARGRPKSVQVQGNNNTSPPRPPLGSPQNGEDSGYPGSISSSSSQGNKTLKSPHDVSPYLDDVTTTRQRGTMPGHQSIVPLPLEQHRRGTVNTAELGMFSPELTDETTPITNLPMPLDPPQWEWSGVQMGGANSNELYPVHCPIEQESETPQSLFDPSKMIIAKVESLSDDSQFNEYLNEILESEEVMECLNSINTDTAALSLVPPPQLQMPSRENEPSTSLHMETVPINTGPCTGQTDVCLSATSAAVISSPATDTATTTQPSLLPSTSGLAQPCAETVAAYVAAETSLVPFTEQANPLLTSLETDTGSRPSPPLADPHRARQELKPLVTLSSPATHTVEIKPTDNVMWSPSGAMEEDSCLQKTASELPLQNNLASEGVLHDSVRCDPPVYQQPLSQGPPPPPVTETVDKVSSAVDVKSHQVKRRIVRVKRRKKSRNVASDLSSTDVGKVENGQRNTADSADKSDPPSEVKSRNGRLIKPSWKVAEISNKALKRTISPITVQDKPPAKSASTHKDEATQPKTKKTRRVRTTSTTASLSLAAVVESGLKRLPDIPATPCSPSPTVSLPSAPGKLSMSLDDILHQMNEEEAREEKSPLEFAESLLAKDPHCMSECVQEGEERNEQVAEGETEKRECSVKRHRMRVVKQAPDAKTATEMDRESTASVLTSEPSGQSQQAPVITEQVTDCDDTSQPLATNLSNEATNSETSVQFKSISHLLTTKQHSEDCGSVNFDDICALDDDSEENWSSPVFKRQPRLSDSKQLSLKTKGASRDIKPKETEDDIEIFADDCDTFTIYTMDETDKNATPPQMPSPPRNSSPEPFRKRPVAEHRRTIQYGPQFGRERWPSSAILNSAALPPTLSIPFFPTGPSAGRPVLPLCAPLIATPLPRSAPPTLLSHPLFPLSTHTPSPPPPPLPPPPKSSSNSTSVHYRLGQSSTLRPRRLCWNFLCGHCSYKYCKYSHVPLDSVSDDELENAILRLSPEIFPQEIAQRYVVKARTPPNNWFPLLIQLIRGLMRKKWDAVFEAYTKLSGDGVVLASSLLSRFLELCREQAQPLLNASVRLPMLAHELLQKIRDIQGSCSTENYRAVLKILDAAKRPVEVMDVYQSMKADGHLASHDILQLVLRGSTCNDDRILQLLKDSKTSSSVTNDIARVANGVLEKASPLLLARNREMVSEWVSDVNGVLDKIGQDALLKLFNLFVSSRSWSSLLALLEQSPKAVVSLGPRLCQPLSLVVSQQPALSDRVIIILEMMPDDSLYDITAEGWNTLLTQCVLPGTSQRATKLCRVISRSNKCLDQEALNALLEMVISSCQPIVGMEILRAHLQFVPPVVPSMTVLGNFCELLLKLTQHEDLYTVVDKLLHCRVAPSLPILQSFVSSCNKEKTYTRLASVVKKAKVCGLHLEKTFYQRALVFLRSWGQDQSAISTIYKSLRTIDTESPGISVSKTASMGPFFIGGGTLPPLHREVHGDSGRSTPGSLASRSSSSRPGSSSKSRKSLEGIFEEKASKPSSAKPGIIALLEGNGKQGQFGAVVSILHNIRDSSKPSPIYSSDVVLAVWRGVTESDQKPANAFSSLLEHFKPAPSPSEGSSFGPPCDRWLVAQLGIALLKMYADTEHWQSGFVILHHLHRYNINYIDHRQPFALLPPLRGPPPSLCALARIAVTTCLKVGNAEFAVIALSECEWISGCSPGEKQERDELLIAVAEQCFEEAFYKECCTCLQELSGLSTTSKHFAPVAKLYNRLLESILSGNSIDIDLSMRVYRNMNASDLPCVPKNFSLLLEKLCNLLQLSTAADLCRQAVEQNFYPATTYGDMFSIHLPPSIHHVEVCCLIEQHLHSMGQKLGDKPLQPLRINFDQDTKCHMEHAFTERLTPSLSPIYTSSESESCATISPANLLNWLNTHFPNAHFHVEEEKTVNRPSSITAASSSSAAGRHVSAAMAEQKGSSALEAHASDSDCSAHIRPTSAQLKEHRKEFRMELCRSIVSELKPHYQLGEKFNSYEDYLHLVKLLTTHVCKTNKTRCGASGEWTVTEVTRNKVRDLVNRVMSQCTTYAPTFAVEFGLTE